jgi:hypothetical protein
MTTEKGNKPRGLKRPVAEVRAELLASEETKHIAKTLGISLEEYVEKVLDYAQHPDKEPILTVVADEAALKAAYPEVKTTAEIVAELEQYVIGKATFELGDGSLDKDGFSNDRKQDKFNQATGAVPTGSHPVAGASRPGSALEDQVQKQLKKGQTPKG